MVVTSATAGTLATTLAAMLDEFDFDGVDIDFEGGSVAGSDAGALATAMRAARQHRVAQGKMCLFSMAPEFPHLREGFYVQLANELASEWDFVLPQLYNQGGDGITVGDAYVSSTNNQEGFLAGVFHALTTPGDSNFQAHFTPAQFCICLPATNWAAGSGYATPATVCLCALRLCPALPQRVASSVVYCLTLST